MRRSASGSVALIAQGPIKSVKREAARHGINPSSCITVGTMGNVQCYAPCSPKTNAAVDRWFDQRTKRADKMYPPGSLLYHGRCSIKGNLSGHKSHRQR